MKTLINISSLVKEKIRLVNVLNKQSEYIILAKKVNKRWMNFTKT